MTISTEPLCRRLETQNKLIEDVMNFKEAYFGMEITDNGGLPAELRHETK